MRTQSMAKLNERREDVVARIRRAQGADNSYAHNDMLLASLERELETIDDDIHALYEDAADLGLFGGAE